MTIGSCCRFHRHRGGEAASTKGVSMTIKCCREACAWLQVSTPFTVVVVVEGGDPLCSAKCVIITNIN